MVTKEKPKFENKGKKKIKYNFEEYKSFGKKKKRENPQKSAENVIVEEGNFPVSLSLPIAGRAT